jgi:hypothetical protein
MDAAIYSKTLLICCGKIAKTIHSVFKTTSALGLDLRKPRSAYSSKSILFLCVKVIVSD